MEKLIKSELQKMRDFEWYNCEDLELITLRDSAALLFRELNTTKETPAGKSKRIEIYQKLFGSLRGDLCITPPFYCDYGKYIHFGKQNYLNFDCVILDGADVTFGDNVYIGPNCHIYTVLHPFDPELRKKNLQIHKEVKVGNNVWLGGGVYILPGVTIGNNCVIGARSVVTKSIPDGCLAVGNPCKVIRRIVENAKL